MGLTKETTDMLESVFDGKMPKDSKGTMLPAKVTGVDPDGTAWVQFAGYEHETPVTRKLAECAKGDDVFVSVGDGIATIIGNISKPSTDDSKAAEANVMAGEAIGYARDASKVATNYMGFSERDGLVVGNMTNERLGGNVQLTGEPAVKLRRGSKILAEFKRNILRLITDRRSMVIDDDGVHLFQHVDLNGNKFELWSLTGFYTDYENHDYVKLSTKGSGIRVPVVMETDSSFAILARSVRFADPNSNGQISNIYGLGPGFRIEPIEYDVSISASGFDSRTIDLAGKVEKILAVSYIRSTDSDIVPYRWEFSGTSLNLGFRNLLSSKQTAKIYVGVLTTL